MSEIRTYPIAERPDVAVLIDRTWYVGVLRQWERRDDGWWGSCEWSEAPGVNRLDTFPAEAIRLL